MSYWTSKLYLWLLCFNWSGGVISFAQICKNFNHSFSIAGTSCAVLGYLFQWCICTSTIYPSAKSLKKSRMRLCACLLGTYFVCLLSSRVTTNPSFSVNSTSTHATSVYALVSCSDVAPPRRSFKRVLTRCKLSIPLPPAILHESSYLETNECMGRSTQVSQVYMQNLQRVQPNFHHTCKCSTN